MRQIKTVYLIKTKFPCIGLTLLALLFFACEKDKPPVKNYALINTGGKRIYVTNEGNYNWGNASITLYNPDNNTSMADIYKPNNNNTNLGDVCQSMIKYNNFLLVVLNNSHKIIALNSQTYKKEHEIIDLNSPRYILPVSNNKAYISDLYNNNIYIADLNSWKINGTIKCSGWTEEMILSYGKVFVCNKKSNYLYVIDTQNNLIIDSVNVGYGSGCIQKDRNEKLWILCSKDTAKNAYSKLVKIDPITYKIELSLSFNKKDAPTNLKINGEGDRLYYLNNGICVLNINDLSIPSTVLVTQGNKNYYGLGIDPEDGTIYVSDAVDYVQNGKIERYTQAGMHINTFSAGIIPSSFYFQQ